MQVKDKSTGAKEVPRAAWALATAEEYGRIDPIA